MCVTSIKEIIDVSGQKRDHAAINDVGAAAKVLAHLSGAVFRVDVDRALPQHLAFFLDDKGDVKASVAKALGGAVHSDATSLEVQIAECAGQAFVEDGGEQITLKLLGNQLTLTGHLIKRVALLVDAHLVDQLAVQHLMKRLCKIQIHDIIVLHNDLVDGNVIQGIVDVAHEIENENLDVVHASDG